MSDKTKYNNTRKDLADRWNTGNGLISDISTEELPRIDISGGKKRPTYRYCLKDIEAYESKHLQGKS